MFGQKQSVLVEIEYAVKSQAAEAEMDRLARKAGFGGVTSGGRIKDTQGRFVNKKQAMEKIEQVKLAEVKDKAQKKQMKGAYGLLGAMFLMAAVSNTILSAMQGAADAVGIFEIMSTILLFLFLPAMLALLPIFLAMLRFVLAIPAPIRELIGLGLLLFAVLLIALGALVSVVLAIVGLVGAFGVSLPIDVILGAVAALVLLVAAIAALGAVVISNADYIGKMANLAITDPVAAVTTGGSDLISATSKAFETGNQFTPLGMLMKMFSGGSNSSSNSTTNIYNPRESNQPVTYNTAGG
ncbi:MAG: hypothetical protein WC451_02580 [Patescibacteria group bacterium]